MINNWEKLIHMKNYRVFQKVMKNSPMMDDPESRSLIGALCVLESIGTTGIKERIKILKEHKIILSRADLYFTIPLILYYIITKLAMRNIVPAMMKSKNMDEFYKNLNPLGRMLVFTHVSSLINFYMMSVELQRQGKLPDVGQDFRVGFSKLYDLRVSIAQKFRPPITQMPLDLTLCFFDDLEFTGINKMMWYMAYTDMLWTRDFIDYIISYRLPVLEKIVDSVRGLIIPKFFLAYMRAVTKLNTGIKLDQHESVLLRMIYEVDMATYSELIFYYSNCNILPDAFFDDFKKFYNNVLLVREKVH